MSHGKSYNEAFKNIQEAIDEIREERLAKTLIMVIRMVPGTTRLHRATAFTFEFLPCSLLIFMLCLLMIIEQTVAIPADYRIFLELPRSVPIGVNARVSISIPTVFDNPSGIEPVKPVKSYRGILKGRGISIKRLRELQQEDKALEEAADERQNKVTL